MARSKETPKGKPRSEEFIRKVKPLEPWPRSTNQKTSKSTT